MDSRIGSVIILITPVCDIQRINQIISDHSSVILGRQGIPLRDRSTNVISLVVEGDTDRIGSLTGQLGRLEGVRVKSALVK
jgi:putative iron-only hydrogenase system regulator